MNYWQASKRCSSNINFAIILIPISHLRNLPFGAVHVHALSYRFSQLYFSAGRRAYWIYISILKYSILTHKVSSSHIAQLTPKHLFYHLCYLIFDQSLRRTLMHLWISTCLRAINTFARAQNAGVCHCDLSLSQSILLRCSVNLFQCFIVFYACICGKINALAAKSHSHTLTHRESPTHVRKVFSNFT